MLSMNEQGKDHQTSPRFSDDQSAKVTADGVEFAEPEICWSNMNENAEDLFEFMSTEGINPRLLQLEDSFPGNTPSSNPLSISKPQQEDCKKNESVRPIPRPKPEPIVTTTTNATISPSMSMEDDGNGNNSGQEEKLYCYCRQPDDFKFMIQCDYCEEWFHGRCVNMNREKSQAIPSWKCPVCVRKSFETPMKLEAMETDCPTPITPSAINDPPSNRHRRLEKKQKSSSSSSKLDWERNRVIRLRVVENMVKVLTTGRDALMRDGNKDARLLAKIDVHKLSTLIEAALFDQLAKKVNGLLMCEDAYKNQFRTLHFNLRTLGNARKVLLGELSPDQLPRMSSEDFADDALKSMKQKVLEESIRGSILTEDMANVILKQARKGHDRLGNTEDDSNAASAVDQNANEPKPGSSLESDKQTTNNKKLKIEEDHTTEMILSQEETVEVKRKLAAESVDLLENLLAKVDENVVITSPAKRKAEISVLHEPSETSKYKKIEPSKSPNHMKPRSSSIWKGRVSMPTVASFSGSAYQVGGRLAMNARDWEALLPGMVNIGGRIPCERVHSYVSGLLDVPSREILLIKIRPGKQPEDVKSWTTLFDYLHSRKRYGVIDNGFALVKDMYLIPLRKEESVPDFVSGLENDLAIKNREEDMLLGAVISSTFQMPKKKTHVKPVTAPEKPAAPPSKSPPAEVSLSPEPPKTQVESTLHLINSLMSNGVLNGFNPSQPPSVTSAPLQSAPQSLPPPQYPSVGPPAAYPNSFGYAAPPMGPPPNSMAYAPIPGFGPSIPHVNPQAPYGGPVYQHHVPPQHYQHHYGQHH